MISRTVTEWGSLQFSKTRLKDSKCIHPDTAQRLFAASENLPISKSVSGGVLTLYHNRIQARGVVGVIQIDGFSLEILPKIDVQDSDSSRKNGELRKRLVHMLSVAYGTKIDIGSKTSLDWQKNTLLEILITVFAEKLADAVRRGLQQKYLQHEEDLPRLRGSLDISRQFTVHAVNPSRLACRFDQFSNDIPINQIIKAAVNFVSKISRNMRNQQLLRELMMVYADISLVATTQLKWDQLNFNRTNERWRELVEMARMLLTRRFQTTTTGTGSGYALLFEMNVLFEEFIGRLIRKAAMRIGLRVSLQRTGNYCLTDNVTKKKKFNTKPDIVVESDDGVTQIIDTKWKEIKSGQSDIWSEVNQGDVYQMMAYGELFQTPHLTLLYPHNKELRNYSGFNSEGTQSCGNLNGQERKLEISSFDLSNGNLEIERLEKLLVIDDQNESKPKYQFEM